MSEFLSECVLRVADNTDDGQFILAAPLTYQSDIAGQTFTVPLGFKTDLASVPRIPIVYELCGGTSNEAAVVHDFLYSTHLVDRHMDDAVLREASAVTGVPKWRRGLMWAGVRVFGASHWVIKPDTKEAA